MVLAKKEIQEVFGGGFFKDLGVATQTVYQEAKQVVEKATDSAEKIFSTVKTEVRASIAEFQEGREDL